MLGEAGTTLSPTPPPVTLPTNPPKSQTEMGQKLESIQQQLEDNNPAEVDLDPPPLNYSISL